MAKKTVKPEKIVKPKAAAKNKPAQTAARNKIVPTKPARKTPAKPARKTPAQPAKAAVRLASKKNQATARPAVKVASAGNAKTPRTGGYAGMRDALLRLRERITGQINFLATDNLNRTQHDAPVDFRSEEQGTDNYDRDFALTRVSSDQNILFEIDEALNRLAMGNYGQCESCSCVISKARMMALPYSRMCVDCQSRSEVDRKRMRSTDTSTFLNSLEKNQSEQVTEDE